MICLFVCVLYLWNLMHCSSIKFENENFVWIFESESYFTVSFIQNICKKLQKWNVNSFDDILQNRVGLLLSWLLLLCTQEVPEY
jgi:hypothetical protein